MDKKVDQTQVEGSAARAADRGSEVDLGWPMGDLPSLGDAGVVRGLVQDFATAVIAVRMQYNEDKLTGPASAAEIAALANQYGKIFMGNDAAYAPLPWNSPDRLGRRLAEMVDVPQGQTSTEALFGALAASLIELAVSHENGQIDDESAKARLTSALDGTAATLLGEYV